MGPALMFFAIRLVIFAVAILVIYYTIAWIRKTIRRGKIDTDAKRLTNKLEDYKYQSEKMVKMGGVAQETKVDASQVRKTHRDVKKNLKKGSQLDKEQPK
ncbi:MAG: hypothetical protein ACXABY_06130 [Candidatus Thorarchaeota archaeon]|jgi:uncharacterized membrane protein